MSVKSAGLGIGGVVLTTPQPATSALISRAARARRMGDIAGKVSPVAEAVRRGRTIGGSAAPLPAAGATDASGGYQARTSPVGGQISIGGLFGTRGAQDQAAHGTLGRLAERGVGPPEARSARIRPRSVPRSPRADIWRERAGRDRPGVRRRISGAIGRRGRATDAQRPLARLASRSLVRVSVGRVAGRSGPSAAGGRCAELAAVVGFGSAFAGEAAGCDAAARDVAVGVLAPAAAVDRGPRRLGRRRPGLAQRRPRWRAGRPLARREEARPGRRPRRRRAPTSAEPADPARAPARARAARPTPAAARCRAATAAAPGSAAAATGR